VPVTAGYRPHDAEQEHGRHRERRHLGRRRTVESGDDSGRQRGDGDHAEHQRQGVQLGQAEHPRYHDPHHPRHQGEQ
jgi:hypothetical protein